DAETNAEGQRAFLLRGHREQWSRPRRDALARYFDRRGKFADRQLIATPPDLAAIDPRRAARKWRRRGERDSAGWHCEITLAHVEVQAIAVTFQRVTQRAVRRAQVVDRDAVAIEPAERYAG